MNNVCYLSIDFEDFSADFKRKYKLSNNYNIRKKELKESYNKINNFCFKYLNKSKITFFCTGILAKKYPKLIKKISDDGHEIGCHYYYHDRVNNDSPENFEKNIIKAKRYLQKASGQPIDGFRAPNFSITDLDIDHFKILVKYFKYDSSLNHNQLNDSFKIKKSINNHNFSIIPVYTKVLFGIFKIKIGGTYLKLLTSSSLLSLIQCSHKMNMAPVIYLHPYEFDSNMSFFISFRDLRNVNFFKKIYLYFKQYQWHYFGNKTVIPKLLNVFKIYKSGGRMISLHKK